MPARLEFSDEQAELTEILSLISPVNFKNAAHLSGRSRIKSSIRIFHTSSATENVYFDARGRDPFTFMYIGSNFDQRQYLYFQRPLPRDKNK